MLLKDRVCFGIQTIEVNVIPRKKIKFIYLVANDKSKNTKNSTRLQKCNRLLFFNLRFSNAKLKKKTKMTKIFNHQLNIS